MKAYFDTAPYYRSHRKEPRGRGSWAFGTAPQTRLTSPEQVLWAPSSMTYAQAKKWAQEQVPDGTYFAVLP